MDALNIKYVFLDVWKHNFVKIVEVSFCLNEKTDYQKTGILSEGIIIWY